MRSTEREKQSSLFSVTAADKKIFCNHVKVYNRIIAADSLPVIMWRRGGKTFSRTSLLPASFSKRDTDQGQEAYDNSRSQLRIVRFYDHNKGQEGKGQDY